MVNLINPQMDHGDDTIFLGLKTEALRVGWITLGQNCVLGKCSEADFKLGVFVKTYKADRVSPRPLPPLPSLSSPSSVTITIHPGKLSDLGSSPVRLKCPHAPLCLTAMEGGLVLVCGVIFRSCWFHTGGGRKEGGYL